MMKTNNRKKGKNSRLPQSAPVIIKNNDNNISPDNEESNSSVTIDVNRKRVQVNIKTPLKVFDKKEYEEKYGAISNANATKNQSMLKLPVAEFVENSSYSISDAPQLPNSYIRFIEKSNEELDGEVEYDMDEEDSAWLKIMNDSREKSDLPPVSMESFEALMDRLEKESYFLVQLNKEVDSSLAVIDDEAVCSICLDGECQNSNVILFCDMCNLAVHQDCYGVPYIPEGPWVCRRCLQSPSAPVDCVLCPNNGGAFKITDRNHWAHVVCALWIPEVRFANTVFLEPIDSIEAIPQARWRLTCYICKQRAVGACIQCHKTNCYSAFHVTCAQQAGLYMKMETVEDNNLGAVLVQKIAYCDSHAPPDNENRAKYTKKEEESVSPNEKMENARKVLAKKRAVAPVISIPTIPPEKIQEIASIITIPKKAHFIQRLIAYWTLKRQFRNGVPLLRRLQTSHITRRDDRITTGRMTDATNWYKQLKHWQTLRQDLERGRLLCELIRKREKMKKEELKIKEQCTMIALCPFNAFLLKVIGQIKARDPGEIFAEPVDQNEVPDYGDIVTHPMDLRTMAEKASNYEYSSLEALEADFNLMVSNCLAYNEKHTIFYKAGVRMKDQGANIFKQAKKDFALNKFDTSTGLLVGQPSIKDRVNNKESVECTAVEEVQAAEIDRELAAISKDINTTDDNEIMCKLLQLLDKSELLKNTRARIKRVKLVKNQISVLKRKMTIHNNSLALRNMSNSEINKSTMENVSQIDSSAPPTPDIKENGDKIEETQLVGSEKLCDIDVSVEHTNPNPLKRKITEVEKEKTFIKAIGGNELANVVNMENSKNGCSLIKRKKMKKSTQRSTKNSNSFIHESDSFRIYRSNNEILAESEEDGGSSENENNCSCSDSDSDDLSSSTSSSGEERFGARANNDAHNCTERNVKKKKSRNDKDKSSSSNNSDSSSSESSSSSSSSSGSSSESNSDDSSSSTSSDDDDDNENGAVGYVESKKTNTHSRKENQSGLNQLQLVWAKCRGFPWYPALIINPDMPKGYVHNGVPIPSPPTDILELAKNFSEPVYLVHFYDAKRTWFWLPRNKLKPLGVSEELDKLKLAEARKPSDRKAIKKAYAEALVHLTD